MKIRIPERQVFAPAKSADAPRVPITASGAEANVTRAVSALGDEIIERQLKAKAQLEIQRVREEANRRQAEFLRDFDPTDHEEMAEELAKWQRQTREELMGQVSNASRNAARANVDAVFQDGLQKADQLAHEYGLSEIRSEHEFYRHEAMARGAVTEDMDEVSEIEGNYYATMDGLVKQGVYSAEDAAKLKVSFSEGIVEDRIQEMMLSEPHAVVNMLSDREVFPRLSSDTRESLLSQAITMARQKDSREEAERRERERLEKEAHENAQDEVFMRLYSDSVSGDLDMADVDRNRDLRLLRPSQYTQLVKVLNSADAQDNREIVDSLMERIMAGDIRNPQVIIGYVGEGVSPKTAERMVEMIGEGAAVVQSRDYRNARDHVDRMLGVTPGIQISSLASDEQQKVARARRELYERSLAGENPWTVVDEMLPRYQRGDPGLPRPRFPTKDAAIDAFMAGRINETVLNQQLELLERHGEETPADVPAYP